MPLVIVGVLLMLAKVADLGPVGGWSWWVVAAPFIAAAVWWQFADASGLTRKREMDKMERRKSERRDKALESLGLRTRRDGRPPPRHPDGHKLGETADPTQASRGAEPPRREPRL